MFLSAYHFDGDPDVLVAAHDKLVAGMPQDRIQLHACVVTGNGITVLDACPSREVFEAFSVSEEFTGALAAVGLPTPRIEPIGAVQSLHRSGAVATTR